jgi:hypothetical protein
VILDVRRTHQLGNFDLRHEESTIKAPSPLFNGVTHKARNPSVLHEWGHSSKHLLYQSMINGPWVDSQTVGKFIF